MSSIRSALLFSIKDAMTGWASGAWTVAYSCNGTTAGTAGDGVDRWVTSSNVVFAGAASAHSWIVLQQPTTGIQILISASPEGAGTLSANACAMSVYISNSGAFTGGATTARPTASDESTVFETGTSILGWITANGTTYNLVIHFLGSTDGEIFRCIVCNSNVVVGLFFFETVNNSVTGWSSPWICGAGRFAGNVIPANAATTAAWIAPSSAAYPGRARINGLTADMTMTVEAYTSNLGPDSTLSLVANEVDGGWPMYPIGVGSVTTGARGRHGSLVDIWVGSNQRSTGDTYPSTGTLYQFAQFGCFIMPWNSSSAPVTA
jgi:hypothetical protein